MVAVALGAWPACNSNVSGPDSGRVDYGITLKNVEGADVKLANFQGKPMVINIWATWCGPCKVETPWLVELSDKYKDKMTFVGISFDDTPEDIRKFTEQYKVPYTMLVGKDREDLAKVFTPEQVLPATWFVKADGTVTTKVTGIHSKEWFDSQIQALF